MQPTFNTITMASVKNIIYMQAILLCAAIFLNSISCSHESKPHEERKLLFVFGDSLFDPGNNQYLSTKKSPAYSWPYGLNNHNHSTGRLSDGLLVPDFIAKFAGLKILPPYMQPNANFSDGVNFASAGAGVLENNNSTLAVMNLRTQLDAFKKVVGSIKKKMGEANTKKILMRSVFLVSLGGNDYFSYNTINPNATEIDKRNCMHMVIGNLTHGLKELYDMGLRKLAVQNVGPLGCYPTITAMHPELNGSCVASFLKHANQHNKALSAGLKKFQKILPGFKYSFFDYFHALGDRLKKPTKYGFKVGNTACCGSGLYNGKGCGGGDDGSDKYKLCKNPNEYVLFDGGHHTQRTNHQLALLLWTGLPNTTSPYNVKQLFDFP